MLPVDLTRHVGQHNITAHSFIKISLLKAYLSLHKFDIFCILETYLDLSAPLNDDNLSMLGYELAWYDHSSNVKRGGTCIYLKNSLPLKVLHIRFLQESKICALQTVSKNVISCPSTSHQTNPRMNWTNL